MEVEENRKQVLSDVLGCRWGYFLIKYLVLPLTNGNLKCEDWNVLVSKFEKKSATWKANILSAGGRSILSNSVLSSIPLYYQSISKIPD